MVELLLPFARRKQDHVMVAVADVARGAACNCVCPGCDQPVIARQGTEREWHFAHAKGDACAAGYEKSVHEFAKQILCGNPTVLLSGLDAIVSGTDAFGHFRTVTQLVAVPAEIRFELCKTNEVVGDVSPDIVAIGGGRRLHIEIVVFHRLSDDKRKRLVRTGVPCVEIDLSVFRSRQATRASLEGALFCDELNRRWVCHPRYGSALEAAQKKLQEEMLESQHRWTEQAKSRRMERDFHSSSAPDDDDAVAVSAEELSERMWRASLLASEAIDAAAISLGKRTGLSVDNIHSVAGTIRRRGDLVGVTPEFLAIEWATRLGVSVHEVKRFLVGAGFVL